MRSFNLFDGELDESRATGRVGAGAAATVGEKIGAEKLGASLYELQPGETTSRTTTSTARRSGCSCVAGRPTLRVPDGEHELRPGDVVCFPEGPEGAHQVRNDSDEPIRVLIASTKQVPDAAVYPDSGKIGIWTGNDETDPPRLFRIGTELDYWDGEA